MNNSSRICYLALALFMTGCTGSSPLVRSVSEQKAELLQTRALRAAEKRDYHSSEQLLRDALVINTSIEDNPQKVITLINLARTHRLTNETDKAEKYLAKAFATPIDNRDIRAENYHEKALLELALHKPDNALESARNSLDLEDGIYKGKRRNLLSRCLYEVGRIQEAFSASMISLSENRSAGLQEEEANSLFMLGTIARDEKRFEEGERQLYQALAIDKQLGLPLKIGRDLEGLAIIFLAASKIKEAHEYFERALEVYRAVGESNKIKRIEGRIQELTTNPSSRP